MNKKTKGKFMKTKKNETQKRYEVLNMELLTIRKLRILKEIFGLSIAEVITKAVNELYSKNKKNL